MLKRLNCFTFTPNLLQKLMSKPKKIQLKDIAKEANVSIASVSYVLNGRHLDRIKKETADRIKETAKRLNYRPNYFAKGLRTQKSNTIGLILADLANPFSAQIARVIENELNHFGYNVLIGSTDEKQENLKSLVDIFTRKQTDGLIILPTENSEKEIEAIHNSDVPYVLVDRYFPNSPFNFVVNDNHFATYSAVKQLVKNGKKKIGFITLKTELFHFAERKRGFVEACLEEHISINKVVKELNLNEIKTEVAPAIDSLRKEFPDLDAILFSTNILTLYGLKYAIQHKLNVPNDIEIMAVDEAEYYDIFPTPITYYKQPLEEIGKKAIQFLMSKMKEDTQTIQEIIKGELIIGNQQ